MPRKRKKQKPGFKQRQTQQARKRNINLKQSETIRGAVASAISKVKMTRYDNDQARLDEIRGYSLEIKGTLTEMEDTLKKFTPPPAVAELQSKPGLSMTEAVQDAKKSTSDLLLNLIQLFGFIGILISDKARAFIRGFFDGILESMGFTKEKIEKIKNIAIVAVGLLGAYLAVSTLKSVADLFNAVINLSKVTMGLLIASDSEVDRSMSEARKRKKERDKVLEEARKAKAKARLERMKYRRKGIKAFAARIFGKIGRGVLTAIPFVGTAAAIAFTVWDIAEELNNYYTEEFEDYELLTDEDVVALKAGADGEKGWTDEEIVEHQQKVIRNRAALAKEAEYAKKRIAAGPMDEQTAMIISASSMGAESTAAIVEADLTPFVSTLEKANRLGIKPEEAKNVNVKKSDIKIGTGGQLQQVQQRYNAAKEKERAENQEIINHYFMNNTNILYGP